jgi:pSer/pThr/pTyr-binding forkhead associated (FHA) protein
MSTDRWLEQPGATLAKPPNADYGRLLADARQRIEQPGEYLCFEENGEVQTVALTREWTRIGRSLAADVRLDDPTVSRRHALIVRHPEGVRLLDDRSLNGVFVNEARVESRILKDGDQIIIGRYRLTMIAVAPEQAEHVSAADPASFHDAD